MPRRQTIVTGKLLNDLWNVGAKHALYRKDGKWYHNLADFPGVLFDANGYIVFETEEDYRKTSHLRITEDLHIKEGISSMPGYVRISEENQFQAFSQTLREATKHDQIYSNESLHEALYKQYEALKVADLPQEQYMATRLSTQIQRIVRDTKISRRVKAIHNYKCQICGYAIDIGSGKFYAEAHHIKPLGIKHNGPDIVENIMCVCPNHHALLDYVAIPIRLTDLRMVSGHMLSKLYIEYHNAIYESERASIRAVR